MNKIFYYISTVITLVLGFLFYREKKNNEILEKESEIKDKEIKTQKQNVKVKEGELKQKELVAETNKEITKGIIKIDKDDDVIEKILSTQESKGNSKYTQTNNDNINALPDKAEWKKVNL